VSPREDEFREREDEYEIEIDTGGDDDSDAARYEAKRGKHGKHAKHAKHTKHRRRPDRDSEGDLDEMAQELDEVRAELEETKDKLLRSLADFDNYRKRVDRERRELTRCANEELIRKLLEVVDNIERALEAAGKTKDLEGFRKGIELIDEHLKDILTREGLCPISCVGESFDPNYHEAVMAIEKEGEESDKVVEEVQKGYTLDGRVIRASKVVVSK
jgi:molecular chaperone GrpE